MALLFSGPTTTSSGTLRRQFIRTQPVYLWPIKSSLLGGNQQWGGTINLIPATAAAGKLEHYDVGNETALLTIRPTMLGAATISNKLTSPELHPLPILAASAVISRQAAGTFTLVTTLTGSAHTETGGNKSGSGTLNTPRVLTGAGTLKHLASGLIALSPVQTLTAVTQLHKTGVGTLTLSPVMIGNSRSTSRGTFVLQPTLSGTGEVRVQSGLWVIIPEDTRGWTVQ